MNRAAQYAILKAFRKAGLNADGSLTRRQLYDGFRHFHPEKGDFEGAIDETIDVVWLETEDEVNGPYRLTDEGYRISLDQELG